jgi:hypothetical protein
MNLVKPMRINCLQFLLNLGPAAFAYVIMVERGVFGGTGLSAVLLTPLSLRGTLRPLQKSFGKKVQGFLNF